METANCMFLSFNYAQFFLDMLCFFVLLWHTNQHVNSTIFLNIFIPVD